MKAYIQKICILLFCCLALAVPVVFAGAGQGGYNGPGNEPGPPDHPDIDYCTTVVAGTVSWVSETDGVIKVSDGVATETTVNGVPLWLNIAVDDYVVINCRISPDGKYVACYLTINGVLFNLR